MSTTNILAILFLWSLFIEIASLIGFCYGAGCIESEREALLKLKDGLSDPSNRLESWSADGDCCTWPHVICDNSTGHVLELHLRTLSFLEYFGHHPYYYQYLPYHEKYLEYEQYYEKAVLGGKISPSLIQLKQLRYLDFSNNNFGGISIPKFFGSMGSLRYLNLSSAGFGGMIPPQLGNLTNLQYLNLQGGDFHVKNLEWISKLSSLKYFDLSYVNLSKSFDWFKQINSLSSLVELYLSECQLSYLPDPLHRFNLSSLAILDLSMNNFIGSLFVPSWISHLKSLVSLDLSYNFFQGPILNVLSNMTSSIKELHLRGNYFNSSMPDQLYGFKYLQVLDLYFNDLQENKLEGEIPKPFKNLCKLRSLSLSGNKLNQNIDDVIEILSSCASNGLKILSLRSCKLVGHLTDDLATFKNLIQLELSNNSISGPIPPSLGEMTSLIDLNLNHNILNGTLPATFGKLTKLSYVDISYNALEGDVCQLHFANLTHLHKFIASKMTGGDLMLRVNSSWIPPLHLGHLDLESWNIGPHFPIWLRSFKNLGYLDLSNCKIAATIPNWFWNISSFFYLNLSHNQIHGMIPNIPHLYIEAIDLSNNNLTGPLPHFPQSMVALDISNNLFSGFISNFLCHQIHEVKSIRLLNLEKNLFLGEIPNCWMNWKNLVAINLSKNRFSGNIPESVGTLIFLESLHIAHNNLSGYIPVSLGNCTSLFTLDFSGNKLVGNIPTWINERFSSMTILNLRANKFDGYMPKELCRVKSLRILDLADNNLFGTIPSCFNNYRAMGMNQSASSVDLPSSSTSFYLECILLVIKGRMMEYSSTIQYVRTIDLSDNNLSGEIPPEITDLAGLQSLNFSHNALNGRIPKKIGAMHWMESMDFSQNQLSGEIPGSISSLTFLSYLNLSNNKLWGKIPTGTQLQGFDRYSVSGNQLCGPPLAKSCIEKSELPIEAENNGRQEDDTSGLAAVDWFYLCVSIATGFVVGFWIIIGPLCFNRRWRFAYFLFLDNFWDKIWWTMYNFCRR